MPRRVDHVLHDILEAIERIEEVTQGKTLQQFAASWQLRWLVQRAIEVISEASRAIPDELADTEPEMIRATTLNPANHRANDRAFMRPSRSQCLPAAVSSVRDTR